jgi:two-component system response regulator
MPRELWSNKCAKVAERQYHSPRFLPLVGAKVTRSHSILLIEDNPDDVELTLRAFRTSTLCNEIVVIRDGVEALDYLFGTGTFAARELHAIPDVILLDLKLPKIGGLALLRRLRAEERTRPIPVIVLTSSSEEKEHSIEL